MWTVMGDIQDAVELFIVCPALVLLAYATRGGTSPIDCLCLALERLDPKVIQDVDQSIYSRYRGIMSPERDHIIIIRTIEISLLTGAISLGVILGILITPRTN